MLANLPTISIPTKTTAYTRVKYSLLGTFDCGQCVCCCCWLHCANLPSSTHLNIYLSIFNPFSFLCTILGLNFLQNDFVTTTRISFSPLETIGNPDIKRWKCIYACEFSADRQISTNTQNKCSVSEYVPFLFSLWWNYLFNTMCSVCTHIQIDVSKQPSIHPSIQLGMNNSRDFFDKAFHQNLFQC